MTNREAIRRILDHKRVHSLNEPRAVLINEALELAIKALENERPQGKWEFYEEDPNDNYMTYYSCSVCGRLIHAKEAGLLKNYPFCHCGADMRGGKKE